MKDLDTIFNEINGHGKFQRILLYLVCGPMFAFLPLVWNLELLVLSVPDHWCYHQMTEGLNATQLLLWKKCYIPTESNNVSYESCEIYLPSEDEDSFWDQTAFDSCPWHEKIGGPNRTSCKKNWSFDQSNFKRTIATDLNWVCMDKNRVPEQFTYSQIGILVGSMGLNYLADRFGRRPMIWISLITIVIPKLANTFLTQYYYVATVLNMIVYSGIIAVYQIPTSMLMEVVDEGYRSWTIMYTWLIWYESKC